MPVSKRVQCSGITIRDNHRYIQTVARPRASCIYTRHSTGRGVITNTYARASLVHTSVLNIIIAQVITSRVIAIMKQFSNYIDIK